MNDTIEGRLPNDATILQRLNKFSLIAERLKDHGISLAEVSNGNPTLEDKTCNFRMTHNLITWQVYHVDEVVDMIVKSRDRHKERNA